MLENIAKSANVNIFLNGTSTKNDVKKTKIKIIFISLVVLSSI
jgi:hypothetical protein